MDKHGAEVGIELRKISHVSGWNMVDATRRLVMEGSDNRARKRPGTGLGQYDGTSYLWLENIQGSTIKTISRSRGQNRWLDDSSTGTYARTCTWSDAGYLHISWPKHGSRITTEPRQSLQKYAWVVSRSTHEAGEATWTCARRTTGHL